MRIVSFNANGLRSAANKGFFDWFRTQDADVLCVQETKAQEHQLAGPQFLPEGYRAWFKDAITQMGLSPTMVVVAMMAIYVVLGTVMEELTMVLLTIPLFFPIVTGLGFDPVWFGVLIVMIVQIGLISPPVGMNLFVLNSLLHSVEL